MNTQKMKQTVKALANCYGIKTHEYVFKPTNYGTEKRGKWHIRIQHKIHGVLFGSTLNDIVKLAHEQDLGYYIDVASYQIVNHIYPIAEVNLH